MEKKEGKREGKDNASCHHYARLLRKGGKRGWTEKEEKDWRNSPMIDNFRVDSCRKKGRKKVRGGKKKGKWAHINYPYPLPSREMLFRNREKGKGGKKKKTQERKTTEEEKKEREKEKALKKRDERGGDLVHFLYSPHFWGFGRKKKA